MKAGRRDAAPRATQTPKDQSSRGWTRVGTIGAAAGGVLVLAALAVLGTGHAAAPRRTAKVDTAAPVVASRDDAADLLARGDYARAEAAYRELLRTAPNDVAARYALGIALSYLDRPGETAEQFEWIVARGLPGQKEVADARHWLDRAGLSGSREARGDGAPAEAPVAEVATGSMKGVTQWPGVTPETKRTKLELRLVGDEPGLEANRLKLYISLGAPYRFARLKPGRYRLIGRTDAQELWNTTVVIEAGAEAALDLTPQNAAVAPEAVAPRAS